MLLGGCSGIYHANLCHSTVRRSRHHRAAAGSHSEWHTTVSNRTTVEKVTASHRETATEVKIASLSKMSHIGHIKATATPGSQTSQQQYQQTQAQQRRFQRRGLVMPAR
ncbi:hypothetical protein KCP69_26690 (plasmid) [Salmonella enterica subsp. enterica]|nr:hypothetical protein KCP69_26690 [Salmonella enterica subsp. enterica]